MSRFQVVPETLVASAGAAQQVGAGLSALAATAAALTTADGLPDATAAALSGFAARSSHHVAGLGDAVHGLGAATAAAAGLYTRTDEAAMH
jgi:hypothetical protein